MHRMAPWSERALRVALSIVLLCVPMQAGAGNLSILLCNNVNVDLFDCVDLVNLYNATDGDNWVNHTNWGSNDVDSWYGVIVDPLSGRVIALDLALNGLDGEFPPSWIGLQALQFLQLSSNALRGELPEYIGDLQSLTFLQVGFNILEGPLPDSLGNLTLLENLFLGGNQFSGPLPAGIGNLLQLEVLDVFSDSFDAGGRLTGPLPDLSGLTRLRRIGLDANRLEGPFPTYLDQMPMLEELRLRGNRLSGPLPANVGSLGQLRVLDLAGNQLIGAMPSTLGNLGALEELDLSFNDFTSTLPSALGDLAQLRVLRIAGNPLEARPQVTGPIPAALANLNQLEELNLEFNRLSGALPECLGDLGNLSVLSLQANDLVGPVPEAFSALGLNTLYLGLNFLDADQDDRLILSPTLQTWFNGIPNTVDIIAGLGFLDSLDQRPVVGDPDVVFASGFEGLPSNSCTGA